MKNDNLQKYFKLHLQFKETPISFRARDNISNIIKPENFSLVPKMLIVKGIIYIPTPMSRN